ncbi:class I SAM-dependent methyltransferase [Amycolatopsis thermalba]|uniref:Class I SAM-dependent methyltransferase n=1 Tax=Amycolatopsis thermalba TaxID=944492 RepID=A0ABY4NZ95_9PSEU|nr:MULTISPECIES: class I SAM-dependent methyltransferase [Amycolatopsis]UQS25420.1 class I SAM-dependent methyltransferase [Amycolatopsis thermalba]
MPDLRTAYGKNRELWDERVAVHRRDASGFYQVEAFLAGKDVLFPIEAAEIGDVRGLRIAHLQCHFGMDSICLARRGAGVTGIDFSAPAIAEARELARRTGTDVRFVEGDVYAARELLDGDFDLVYTTWGTIVWLHDVAAWARVVAALLKPGGSLYFADGHPMMLCLELADGRLTVRDDWRTPPERPIVEPAGTTYTGDQAAALASHEWIHPLADMLNAFAAAGLRLDWVHEHTRLTWPYFPGMERDDDGMYRLPEQYPKVPLSLSLRATKQ